jgi:hypothetical protein
MNSDNPESGRQKHSRSEEMLQMHTIPKFLERRTRASYAQRIPKKIWQTITRNVVPSKIRDWANTWIKLNPEYDYNLVDDDGIRRFISSHFPEYLQAFDKTVHGASKADLWRYLVMFKYGGVYADIDCICLNPLREWIDPEAAYVTQLGVNKDVCQWLAISVSGNPIFLQAAERALANILNGRTSAEYRGFELRRGILRLREENQRIRIEHQVLALAGPPILQEAAEVCFNSQMCTEIFRRTQVVCTSEDTSCNFKGNVKHDYGNVEYLEALKQLQTPHY